MLPFIISPQLNPMLAPPLLSNLWVVGHHPSASVLSISICFSVIYHPFIFYPSWFIFVFLPVPLPPFNPVHLLLLASAQMIFLTFLTFPRPIGHLTLLPLIPFTPLHSQWIEPDSSFLGSAICKLCSPYRPSSAALDQLQPQKTTCQLFNRPAPAIVALQ